MGTFMETFCLDAPAGTDLEVVFAAFRSARADMVMDEAALEAYATEAPGGSARLLVRGVGLAGTAGPVAGLLEEIGTSRAAIDTDWGHLGSRLTVLAMRGGQCRTVHRVTTLGVDHSDPAAVHHALDRHWDGIDPRSADRRCAVAVGALAEVYQVDPAALAGLDPAASEGWWDALDLPLPGPGVGKPLI